MSAPATQQVVSRPVSGEDRHRRDDASREVLRALLDVKRWIREATRTVYAPYSTAAVMTLVLVDEHGPARLGMLAERAHVDASVMTRQMQHLEQQGLVERRPDPEDGRAQLVRLSEHGRAVLAEGRARLVSQVVDRLAAWESRDLDDFAKGLRRLLTDLSDKTPA